MCSVAQVRAGAGLALTYPVQLLLHLFSCSAKGQSSGAASIVSQNLHRQIPLALLISLSALCTVVLASLNLQCMKYSYMYTCGGVTDFKNKTKFPRDVHHIGNLALSVNHLNSLISQLAYR